MDKLKLRIDKKTFQSVLKGDEKILRRYVYPNNAQKYVIEEDKKNEKGEDITVVTPVHYDAIQLTIGRKEDAPRLTAKVVSSEFVVLTDEEGEDLTFEENGIEYYVCQVWFTLGDIIETANVSE